MVDQYLLEIAYRRQQEMLQQAETQRLGRQLLRNRPGLLKRIAHRLLAVARQSNAPRQSNSVTPIFSQKQ